MRIHTSPTTVSSWTGEFHYAPSVFVQPESVEDIVRVVKDRETFPAPVRAVGSNHSTVPVGDPDEGTIVDMRQMNRILDISENGVRVEAGALYVDVAKELERRNLQFHANPIIGNLTVGAAASTGTKDAAIPGELGQLSSYARAMTLVNASGEVVEVNEDDDPELMRVLRSSYGALGIIVDVTFSVKPLEQIEVTHRKIPFSELRTAIPKLLEEDASQLLFIYPFIDSMAVESVRRIDDERSPGRFMRTTWPRLTQNIALAPAISNRILPSKRGQRVVNNMTNRLLTFLFPKLIRNRRAMPADRTVRYADNPGIKPFTFSLWGFPANEYPDVVLEYRDFVREYERTHRYRHDVLSLGFVVPEDSNNIFSYSRSGTAITLDPVATGGPGWVEFCRAFNEFCSERGGVPLLNQTPELTPEQVRTAFGERLDEFNRTREQQDPDNRFLNQHLAHLLGQAPVPASVATDNGEA